MLSSLPATTTTTAPPIVAPAAAAPGAAALPPGKATATEETRALHFAAVLGMASSQPEAKPKSVTQAALATRSPGATPDIEAAATNPANAASRSAAKLDRLLLMPRQDAADPLEQDGGVEETSTQADAGQGIGALLAQLLVAKPSPAEVNTVAATSNAGPVAEPAAGLPQAQAQTRAEPDASLIHARSTAPLAAKDPQAADPVVAGEATVSPTAQRTDKTDKTEGLGADSALRLAAALPPQQAAAGSEAQPPSTATAVGMPMTSVPGAAPPTEARLPASPGSADFGPQLGTQLTTFVRAGVEHARLHLHPVEMGPVSVQIQLDGQTAVVHLSAEHAGTRQALEQAMPLLAGSLREAGLTLTGGGVFEQPRQDKRPADGGAGRDTQGGAATQESQEPHADRIARGITSVRRRGVVDLVA